MEYQSSNSNSNSAVITTSNGPANGNASNTASDSKNRKPATAQQLVRENVQYLIEQLEAGHSETLTAFLRAMAIFREYSFGNSMAIARQHPTATRVAGMYAWNQLGRFVNKGEKGIAILAPVIGKRSKHAQDANTEDADADKHALLGFRRVYVWDRLSRDLWPSLYAPGVTRKWMYNPVAAKRTWLLCRFTVFGEAQKDLAPRFASAILVARALVHAISSLLS
jgi:hypothetical protein